LIVRIIRDYDQYIQRSLERGTNAKELNVSKLKVAQFKFKDQYQKMKTSVSEFKESFKTEPLGTTFDRGVGKIRKKMKDVVMKFAS
jgi:choline-phosphate cytidylyltransferase